MNKINLIGRLTRDPEVRYTQSVNPVAVTNFSIAVNRSFKRENEPDVDFINCVAFGKTGELITKYCGKGRQVGISGRLQIDHYQKDGENRTAAKVIVEEVTFCGNASDQNNNTQQTNNQYQQTVESEEDLPF